MSELAIFGGEKAVKTVNPEMTKWPIITSEEEVEISKRHLRMATPHQSRYRSTASPQGEAFS